MINRHDFTDKAELAANLAQAVASDLRAGIEMRGAASLAISGGNTPKAFFAALSQIEHVDWSKVIITLVDERWVDATSDRSNAALVAQNLIQNQAATARFVPLYAGGEIPTNQLVEKTNTALKKGVPMPFDAVVLGMGNDGHTASFFPGADVLEAALTSKDLALGINAPGADEPRITLTLPTILNTKNLYLHIEGPGKAQTLKQALADDDVHHMPVRAVLFQNQMPVQIFWCQ